MDPRGGPKLGELCGRDGPADASPGAPSFSLILFVYNISCTRSDFIIVNLCTPFPSF